MNGELIVCTQVHQLPAGNNTHLVYMLENQKHIETTKNHDAPLRLIFNCRLGWVFFRVALFCLFRCLHDSGALPSRRIERPRVTGEVHDAEDGPEGEVVRRPSLRHLVLHQPDA